MAFDIALQAAIWGRSTSGRPQALLFDVAPMMLAGAALALARSVLAGQSRIRLQRLGVAFASGLAGAYVLYSPFTLLTEIRVPLGFGVLLCVVGLATILAGFHARAYGGWGESLPPAA